MSPLSNVLRAAMRQRGWDSATLSAKSGIPKQTLSNILNDKNRGAPEVPTLRKLADALEIDVGQLVLIAGHATEDRGSNTARLAALLDLLPWLGQAIDRIAALPEEEARQYLDYVEYRYRQIVEGTGPSNG